jgi:hypothetical protein
MNIWGMDSIYLMTVKPGIAGSFVTLVISIILGVIVANILLGSAMKSDRSIVVNSDKTSF